MTRWWAWARTRRANPGARLYAPGSGPVLDLHTITLVLGGSLHVKEKLCALHSICSKDFWLVAGFNFWLGCATRARSTAIGGHNPQD